MLYLYIVVKFKVCTAKIPNFDSLLIMYLVIWEMISSSGLNRPAQLTINYSTAVYMLLLIRPYYSRSLKAAISGPPDSLMPISQ